MSAYTTIPDWDTFATHLHTGLAYTDATLKRTRYTYNIFIREFCGTEGCVENRIEEGIEQISNAYKAEKISKDKLLRLRRVAFRLLQLIRYEKITWDRIPLYGKKHGTESNETILASFVFSERRGHNHAESIIRRDENIIRQYILFAESRDFNIIDAGAHEIISFLAYMRTRRPAGLQSTASALKHFYLYLVENENSNPNVFLAIKVWNTPHTRVYGVFTKEEKQELLDATDSALDTGKRDKAVLMLAIDCGLQAERDSGQSRRISRTLQDIIAGQIDRASM